MERISEISKKKKKRKKERGGIKQSRSFEWKSFAEWKFDRLLLSKYSEAMHHRFEVNTLINRGAVECFHTASPVSSSSLDVPDAQQVQSTFEALSAIRISI